VIRKTLYRGFDNMTDLQRDDNLQMQGMEFIMNIGEFPTMGLVLKQNHKVSVSTYHYTHPRVSLSPVVVVAIVTVFQFLD
jgi:hypothetical protein